MGDSPWARATGDSKEFRSLAASVRDEASLHPSADDDADYNALLHDTWGGPAAPRWFDAAMEQLPQQHASQRGRRALVTGSSSGIGFFVAKLLAAVGMVIILPARPQLTWFERGRGQGHAGPEPAPCDSGQGAG